MSNNNTPKKSPKSQESSSDTGDLISKGIEDEAYSTFKAAHSLSNIYRDYILSSPKSLGQHVFQHSHSERYNASKGSPSILQSYPHNWLCPAIHTEDSVSEGNVISHDTIEAAKAFSHFVQDAYALSQINQDFIRHENKYQLRLDQEDLWAKFHYLGNEMILTRNGRCFFPLIKGDISNLDPIKHYTIMMDVVPVSKRRLRFRNGSWNYSQKSEELSPIGLYKMYKSEEQAVHGENLMKNGFSFAKAKLSNDQGKITDIDFSKELISQVVRENQSNHLIVQSFYRYVPRIHIVEHDTKDLSLHDNLLTTTFTFQELEFVGVTHYQNQAVNSLKKSYNPHAKGFKEDIAIDIPLKDKWALEPPKIEFWDLKSAVMDGLRLFDISRGNAKRKRGDESSSSDEEWH